MDEFESALTLLGQDHPSGLQCHAMLGELHLKRAEAILGPAQDGIPRQRPTGAANALLLKALASLRVAQSLGRGSSWWRPNNLLKVLKAQHKVAEAVKVATEFVFQASVGVDDQALLEVGKDAVDLRIRGHLEKGPEALALARRCLSLPGAKRDAGLLHLISYIFKDNWRMEEMGQVLQWKLDIERRPLTDEEAVSLGQLTVPNPNWLHKLEHDAEQFEYLAAQGINASYFGGLLAPAYRLVYQSMKGAVTCPIIRGVVVIMAKLLDREPNPTPDTINLHDGEEWVAGGSGGEIISLCRARSIKCRIRPSPRGSRDQP